MLCQVTMSWNKEWTQCLGCTTIISGDGCHKWHGYCSTCWIDPQRQIDAADARALTSAGLLDKRLADDFGHLQQQLDKVNVDAVQLDMQGLRAQIGGLQADAGRRQQEMEAMRRQMDELQHQLRAVTASLPPPAPPASANGSASSTGSSSPPQPPPPPSYPPHQPPAALPVNPVHALLAISNAAPRRTCCPHCRATADGTTCPGNPLPTWLYDIDYCQVHWGMTKVALSDYFSDSQGVSLTPTSWLTQQSAIEDLLYFDGGADTAMKNETLRCLHEGLSDAKLEIVWHRTKSASHIVLGLRCLCCGFMFGAEWSSPGKYPMVKQKVEGVQLAVALWLGIDLPTSLNDGPRAN